MNVVLIIVDSLRQDHVGAYGNPWIKTPHLDAFAKEAMMYTRCYPDSLPTLQARRALHTGVRSWPFKDFADPDNRTNFPRNSGYPIAGWGPLSNEYDCLAELFLAKDYDTAYITDCYHTYNRGFQRGFTAWEWIRGQEGDRYHWGVKLNPEEIFKHMPEKFKDDHVLYTYLHNYKRNHIQRHYEEDFTVAQVFKQASHWIEDLTTGQKYFMVLDSFDPHEPWDPPVYYRRLYDRDDEVADIINCPYRPWKEIFTPRELKRLQANYAGEVTMFDRWFGYFMETMRLTGKLEDTVVAVISDHGINLGHDPRDKGFCSKHPHPQTRSVADLVTLLRHPHGLGAGLVCRGLCYNFDLPYSLLKLAGVEAPEYLKGVNLDMWQAALEKAPMRDHITIGWGACVSVVNDKWWYNADVWGEGSLLYDLDRDPDLTTNLASEHAGVCREMLDMAYRDSGEENLDYMRNFLKRGNTGLWTPYVRPWGNVEKLWPRSELPQKS